MSDETPEVVEYELKRGCGQHIDEHGRVIRPGQSFDSEIDMVAKFPGKFRRVVEDRPTEKLPTLPKKTAKKTAKKKNEIEDVTADFENADKANVQVLKNGRKYDVLDSDGEPLTEKSVSKTAVLSLIDDRMEGGDEDE